MSRKQLEYTIDEPDCGDDEKKTSTIVLIHGFPDDVSVWNQTSQFLCQRGFRVVRIALPGFEQKQPSNVPVSFDDVVERLRNTLIHTQSWGGVLIGHDWGAIFLYMLLHKYPDAAQKIITLEIGAAPRSVLILSFVLFYHSILNVIYGVGGGIGDRMMQWFCFFLPRSKEYSVIHARATHAWLYRQAWKEGGEYGPWHWYFRNIVSLWKPQPHVPFLFLFGTDTHPWLRFHCKTWREDATSVCSLSRVVGLPGRHWFFLESPEEWNKVLIDFTES